MSESRAQNTYLLIPIVLLSILASTAAIRGPSILSLSGFGSAIIVAAPLILATYALMSVAIAGRGTVDLAIGPLLAFINVSLVTLNGLNLVTSPIAVFIVALGIGIIYQVLFALAIIVVRVQPIIVALSGFLALSGINRIILPRPGGVAPEWMGAWGLGNTIFSPILLILILATAGWLLFTLSPFYKHLRAMGYDERAAFTSGVRINLVRVGAHIIAGVFVGLGAICYTALIASGDPTQGTTMSLTAVTAVVLGGVSLSGGRGSVIGALLGAINLFLIGYVLATFNFGAVQAFVTQLFYGLILILSLLLTLLVPIIGRYIYFISPFAAFIVLAVIVAGIMLQVSTAGSLTIAAPVDGSSPGPTDDLLTRFLILPPTSDPYSWSPAVSPWLPPLLLTGVVLLLATFVLRMIVVEATADRFGVFGHAFAGGLVLLLLIAVYILSGPVMSATGGPAP
jgi:ribose transport system permease protein